MTNLLAIVGTAALFVLFGLMTRRWKRFREGGCSCIAPSSGCGSCPANPERVESDHAER